jgi:hypothetical protein
MALSSVKEGTVLSACVGAFQKAKRGEEGSLRNVYLGNPRRRPLSRNEEDGDRKDRSDAEAPEKRSVDASRSEDSLRAEGTPKDGGGEEGIDAVADEAGEMQGSEKRDVISVGTRTVRRKRMTRTGWAGRPGTPWGSSSGS